MNVRKAWLLDNTLEETGETWNKNNNFMLNNTVICDCYHVHRRYKYSKTFYFARICAHHLLDLLNANCKVMAEVF